MSIMATDLNSILVFTAYSTFKIHKKTGVKHFTSSGSIKLII